MELGFGVEHTGGRENFKISNSQTNKLLGRKINFPEKKKLTRKDSHALTLKSTNLYIVKFIFYYG